MEENQREGMNRIIASLPFLREAASALQEVILASVVMIGEIPAPTFREQARVRFIENRFAEMGLQSCTIDERGNALGVLPGSRGEANILVVARADTVFPENVDHTISVHPEAVYGPGVGNNSVGAAVVATLPMILDLLEVRLQSNLILMGATRSLGRGNLEGLRFFLAHNKLPLRAGICVEGVPLGLLSHSSVGLVRGEVRCRLPDGYDWTRYGAVGSIVTLNEVINRILEIPLPKRPRTAVVFNSIEGGKSFDTNPSSAVLRLEIRSESWEMVRHLRSRLEEINAEVSAQTGSELELEIVTRRKPGGILYTHPLAIIARRILKALDIEPRKTPSTSDLAAFAARRIPALTVGITQGELESSAGEYIRIKPIYSGLAQLIGIIQAIDGGFCDDDQQLA